MIFITGTDTGCGKTTVGRAICAALAARGVSVGVFKPAETGCEEVGGNRVPADAVALAEAARSDLPIETICPYRLRMPASPERAATDEGLVIDRDVIVDAWSTVRRAADFAIAEGAGGLLVPIAPGLIMADLPSLLDLPVLVVARDALGTVNHSLLTIEAIQARRLDLVGIVFSSPEPGPSALENAHAVAAHSGARLLGTLPFLCDPDDATLARSAEENLDLDHLLERCGR